jgi:long-chain acyl-CoA synthetase
MEVFDETSVCAVFRRQARACGDEACVASKRHGAYQDISWRRMEEDVHRLAAYLLSLGVGPGDTLGIFSHTRHEWWLADLATLSVGAADVPVYASDSAEEARYILEHAGCRLCFVGDREQLELLRAVQARLPALEGIVVFDDLPDAGEGAISLAAALRRGAESADRADLDARIDALEAEDLATIIYTSGTTGPPKGVMLSHGNLMANVRQIHALYGGRVTMRHNFLSFLPLSHALERMGGYYLAISNGVKVSFAEDIAHLLQNLREVRPTAFLGVPRLFEKMYRAIQDRVQASSALRRRLFAWSEGLARENAALVRRDEGRRGSLAVRYGLADRLVFRRIKRALGLDRLRFAISGGNALSEEVAGFFMGLDIHILEGYGMTETSPIVSSNRHTLVKLGTVGPPLCDTEVRIAPDGEILVKGPQVMLGYHRDDQATRAAFTPEGYLRTGDLGRLDEDGYLIIDGRKKDVLITSGGKNISPHNLERRLLHSRFIAQVAAVGDGRRFVACLIVPAFEELAGWARQAGLPDEDPRACLDDPRVQGLYQAEIDRELRDVSRPERVKRFTLLDHEWTQADGSLTPSLKVKRQVVEERYRETIDTMYRE